MLPTIPPDIAPWLYYLYVGVAVLMIGLTKSGFGMGAGLLGISLLTLAMPPQEMLGITLVLLILGDIPANISHRGHQNWGLLCWLIVGAVLGVAIGSVVLVMLQGLPSEQLQRAMRLTIGAICLGVIVLQAFRLFGKEMSMLPMHPVSSIVVAAVAATVSTLAHAAGPIIGVYLLQARLTRRKFVGTLAMYFLLINLVKVPTFIWRELLTLETLRNTIWTLPVGALGAVLGFWMHNRIPEKIFSVVIYVGATAAAAKLILMAIVG